jgi:2-keto-4-pentenoate hydratase/2-oxohepta-3-ene-1,7-dioic acid hydratase in catechol pathway
MRIVRFVGEDGQVHHGEDRGDGSALLLADPQGVLGGDNGDGGRDLLRGKRAVVADDDDNMRDLMATTLRKVGCQCTVCSDGAQAIEAIHDEPVDLVVSDIVMPHHNGYEIFSAAKARQAHLPVVLVTGFGYDPNHVLVRAAKEGLAAVLYKPFSPQQLIEEIRRAILEEILDPADALVATGEQIEIKRPLAPLHPTDIICVGRNYPGPHGGTPDATWDGLEVFTKPSAAAHPAGEPIRLPAFDGIDPLVTAEGELAVIIGTTAHNLESEEDVARHVLGYTAANDLTATRWQTREGAPRWMRGKGFATFCPLGPVIVTRSELPDPDDLLIETRINGETVRQGRTADMIHSVDATICELSRHMTLEAGTVILTGAPPLVDGIDADARFLRDGDEVAVSIEGIGRLVNPVATG